MGDLTDLKRSNQLKGLGCLPPDAGSMSILQGGKMKKYNYDSIIHLLLNKYGWIRVPWFVSLKEMPDDRRV